jgi:hypothetical protein
MIQLDHSIVKSHSSHQHLLFRFDTLLLSKNDFQNDFRASTLIKNVLKCDQNTNIGQFLPPISKNIEVSH